MLDALIIGGGPAGCSCAIWLRQLGFAVTLVERGERLGGLQALSPYPNTWVAGLLDRTGVEFARDLERQVRELGIPVLVRCEPARIEAAGGGWEVDLAGGHDRLRVAHLVIATGVAPSTGGLEPAPDVLFGPGAAIESYDFRGKSVAILGGGDNAAENYAIIREKSPARLMVCARAFHARPPLLDQVPEESRRVGDYRVEAGSRTVSLDGASERFDTLVVMYGWEPRIPAAVAALGPERDARGFLRTDAERRTSVERLWAIGEVTQALHPCCVTSMSDGVICAKAIETAIRGPRER